MTYSALAPLAEALFAQLQDATLLAAVAGGSGVCGSIPEDPLYPLVWVELLAERDLRGLGAGELNEIGVRVHVFSRLESPSEAQGINRLVVGRLKDASLTVTGYASCGAVCWDDTVNLSGVEMNGVLVQEIVSLYRVYLEAA